MNCKNCGEIVEGRYCSQCGQHSNVGKITMSNLAKDFSSSVFQVNKGFFYTLLEMSTRPGTSIKEYLEGKRKRHFKPITYVLTVSTIYFLISQITGQNTWMDEVITGFHNGALNSEDEMELPPGVIWFSKNFAYTTLLLLPVFSFASYLSFRGFGLNFIEHLVLNSYLTGQKAIFYSLFALLKSFMDYDILELLPVLIAFIYSAWVFGQIFKSRNRMANILRTILTYGLYLIFSAVLLIGLIAISEISK